MLYCYPPHCDRPSHPTAFNFPNVFCLENFPSYYYYNNELEILGRGRFGMECSGSSSGFYFAVGNRTIAFGSFADRQTVIKDSWENNEWTVLFSCIYVCIEYNNKLRWKQPGVMINYINSVLYVVKSSLMCIITDTFHHLYYLQFVRES